MLASCAAYFVFFLLFYFCIECGSYYYEQPDSWWEDQTDLVIQFKLKKVFSERPEGEESPEEDEGMGDLEEDSVAEWEEKISESEEEESNAGEEGTAVMHGTNQDYAKIPNPKKEQKDEDVSINEVEKEI